MLLAMTDITVSCSFNIADILTVIINRLKFLISHGTFRARVKVA